MGLFTKFTPSSAADPNTNAATTTKTTTQTTKSGLFKKHSNPSPASTSAATTTKENESTGLFRRGTKSGAASRQSSGEAPSGWNFSKHDSLSGARTKLKAAQEAEAVADAALIRSRQAVKEARAEIVALEKEAELEAKQAKEKQKLAKGLRTEGNKLGRHL